MEFQRLAGTWGPACIVLASAAFTGTPALAQAAPDTPLTLQPVAVEGTAEQARGPVQGYVAHRSDAGTKTDTPLIETPQSISVVTRDQMDTQNAQTLSQALRYTVGVKTDALGADVRFDGQTYIRGFQADQYLDGLKLPRGSFTGPAVEPWLLERIDVVHGPASVLYGQASPGGFIDLISKLPTEDPLHVVQVTTGSYGLIQGAFDLGGKASEDGTWLYRLTGIARDSGTQVDHTTVQRLAFAPAITWKPNADTKITFLASVLRDPQGGFYNQLPWQGTILPNPHGAIPTSFYGGDENFDHFRRTQLTLGYALEHRLDDVWTLRQNVRYLYQDLDYSAVYQTGFQPNLLIMNRDAFSNREIMNAVALDNTAQADFTTGPLRHTVLLGVGYQNQGYNGTYREGPAPPLNYLNPVYQLVGLAANAPYQQATAQVQNQVGLYAQDQIRLDGWSLTLGVREDWLDTQTVNNLTGTKVDSANTATSWRGALMYNFANGLAPYFSYTTSFQPTSGTNYAGAPFQPTKGQQYEVGVKYQPPAWNALLTVALFDLTQQNVLTPDPLHVNFNTQAGEVRSRGVEFSAKASLAQGLNLILAYSYLDNTTTKANGIAAGKHPPALPQHLGSLWTDYAFQDETFHGLQIGAGVRVVGGQWANTANTVTAPGYALFDAMARYDLGAKVPSLQGMAVQLNATNIGDTRYVVSAQNSGAYYGLRRTVLANLTYQW
ncbi:MAG: TonB-dependent siderophore receptor [Rhodospirillales bacterium]|nr:TonB-dependent siderophore receptor [Rhodospirillales bacterium]